MLGWIIKRISNIYVYVIHELINKRVHLKKTKNKKQKDRPKFVHINTASKIVVMS